MGGQILPVLITCVLVNLAQSLDLQRTVKKPVKIEASNENADVLGNIVQDTAPVVERPNVIVVGEGLPPAQDQLGIA